MSNIQNVPISQIEENPHRQLATYPTIEKKIDMLQRSIEDLGLWEGIIARRKGDVYQLAFGHHRLEAAKRAGLTEIPLIVRDLDDEAMIKFMGRENGEDYATEFLIMLNTWEGAVKFQGRGPGKFKALDVARLLGWTAHSQGNSYGMNETAKACASAHALISGGHMSREDLEGLSVKAAKEIVQRAHSRMETIEKAANTTSRPRKEVDQAKKHVAKGAKITARQVKEGTIPQKDIRSQVDVNAFKSAATSKVKDSPLFAVFGKALADSIGKMLNKDHASEKLEQITESVNKVTMEADHAVLRQLDYQLSELGIRSDNWRKRLIPTSEKVVGLPQLEKKDNG